MNITRVLRPAQRILTGTVVAAVAVTTLVSASTSTTQAAKEGRGVAPATSAMKEWKVRPGDSAVAMKEWRSKESSPLVTAVAQAAYPAMSTGSYEKRTLRQINRVRKSHHLGKLSFARCPNKTANRWSSHLASSNGFYHQSMTRLLRKCGARYAGETLGMGSVTPRKLVSMWMHSPPHRHILMSRSPKRIGIGATPNSAGQWVVAANFMRF